MNSHLKEVNETYFEHMYFAQKSAWRMIFSGMALLIHSVIPSIFVSTASDTMQSVGQELAERKSRKSESS